MMTEKEYGALVTEMSPRSKLKKHCIGAFLTGGLICTLGQVLLTVYEALGIGDGALASSISLIALSALLTGLSLYDDIAKYAGAGTLVPITGFANSIASAAVEYKSENMINGVGCKMFTIAGPVIVYGTAASVVYGFIYWLAAR